MKENQECLHPTIGILFSGGIDCTILALLANEFIEEHRSIDLINVSFEKVRNCALLEGTKINYDTPDRLSGKQTLLELQSLCPQRYILRIP